MAKHYKLLGQVGQSVAHIPVGNTRAALNQKAPLHADGATGKLKLLGGPTAGIALAVGPQAFLDYSSSTTTTEFYNASVYTQPTNVISALVGIGAGAAVTAGAAALALPAAPLVLVIAVGYFAGVLAQYVIIETGLDRTVGNALRIGDK